MWIVSIERTVLVAARVTFYSSSVVIGLRCSNPSIPSVATAMSL